ncbi:MAG TPA: hypothetical protein PKA38_02850 [Candidatus Levybacteria bacterium]|nr:hypothetical protein [Candidatus Levybacteria bacterium]
MKLKLINRQKRNLSQSARKIGDKKRNDILFLLFFIGITFFSASILLYIFQDTIPKIKLPSSTTVMNPRPAEVEDSIPTVLNSEGVVFEKVYYATESPTIVVRLPDNVYAYLLTNADSVSQVRLLKNILLRLQIENKNKKLKYVDLRFEKPIIKF